MNKTWILTAVVVASFVALSIPAQADNDNCTSTGSVCGFHCHRFDTIYVKMTYWPAEPQQATATCGGVVVVCSGMSAAGEPIYCSLGPALYDDEDGTCDLDQGGSAVCSNYYIA